MHGSSDAPVVTRERRVIMFANSLIAYLGMTRLDSTQLDSTAVVVSQSTPSADNDDVSVTESSLIGFGDSDVRVERP